MSLFRVSNIKDVTVFFQEEKTQQYKHGGNLSFKQRIN